MCYRCRSVITSPYYGRKALIRRCDDLPTTIIHVPVAAVLVLNTPDDGRLRPKHVEWSCRNKTCTVLHQVGVSRKALIRSCDDWPATITHVPVAAVLALNTPDDGRLRPKHVEWPCRNKTCTMLHQVGVSFDLYYDARKHKIKKNKHFALFALRVTQWDAAVHVSNLCVK